MNWNNNDTKYILKRVIVYFVIASILFFAGQRCAKAATYSNFISDSNNYKEIQSNYTSVSFQVKDNNGTYRDTFVNAGTGYLIFNYMINQNTSSTVSPIYEISIQTYPYSIFNCETSNLSRFIDSSVDYTIGTAKCPIQFTDGKGLRYIHFNRQFGVGLVGVTISKEATIVTTESEATGIITEQANTTTAIVNASMTQIAQNNQINSNLQSVQQAVADSMTQSHQDSQAQVNAINDLTNTINAGYSSNTGTGYLNAFDNIFTQQDENVIRQFVMIPFNLYILLYNSITSGSCQSISLGALYGVNLDLPCIDLRSILGVGLYTAIDTIFGACLLFGIVRMIKKFFNSLFSLSSKATDECGIEVFK